MGLESENHSLGNVCRGGKEGDCSSQANSRADCCSRCRRRAGLVLISRQLDGGQSAIAHKLPWSRGWCLLPWMLGAWGAGARYGRAHTQLLPWPSSILEPVSLFWEGMGAGQCCWYQSRWQQVRASPFEPCLGWKGRVKRRA